MNKIKYLLALVSISLLLGGFIFAQSMIYPEDGGTGTKTLPLSGQLLIGKSNGTYIPAYLSAGSNISITNSSGYITITASGGGATTTINSVSGPTFTFATTSDTNLGLSIATSTGTLTFTPVWLGTLADGRIASAGNWNTAYNYSQVGHLPLTGGTISGTLNLATTTVTTLTVSNAFNLNGKVGTGMDMNNNLILNIGNATTDFTSSGGLTLAGALTGNATATFAGRVGIGLTTGIDTRLAIKGSDYTSGILKLAGSEDTVYNLKFNSVLRGSSNIDFDIIQRNLSIDYTALSFRKGMVAVGTVAPTAALHIKAGTAATNTAPLKFTSGSLLAIPEAGAVEFLTDAYYGTITTGAARKTFAFLESPAFTGTSIFAGNVGIATTSPAYKLSVNGTFGVENGTSTFSKNVVINTAANPGIALQVLGDNNPFLRIGSTVLGNSFDFSRDGGTGALFIQGNQGGYNNIVLNPTSGNVGIATTTPAYTLDVFGTTSVKAFIMPTGASNGYVLTSDAGGIGTWQTAGAATDIYWTGTSTNLVAATGRASLGLGTMAVANTSDYLATGTAASTYFTISNANASNTSWLADTKWDGGATDLVAATGRTSLELTDTVLLASSTWAKIANNLSDLASSTVARTNLVLGNVENTALSTWAGSANILTVGTIGTGSWNATAIANTKGGTGQDSSGWTGYAYITGGTWATSSGASAGVSSLNTLTGDLTLWGTANQLTVTASSTVGLVLSLPQNIHTGASPTFAGLTLTNYAGLAKFTAGVLGTTTIGFTDLTGSATDAQIPDDITITNNATTGTANMSSLTGISSTITGALKATAGTISTTTFKFCFSLENASDTDDNIVIWTPDENMTIVKQYCRTQGGTNVVMHISDGTNDMEDLTCVAAGQADDGTLVNNTFTANERMEFDITSVSGSVTWVNFCNYYQP